MASNIQNQVLKSTAEEIAANIVYAIKNKPIKRYTKNKGSFQSVVNASGALAASVRIEYTPTGFRIWAYDYIDALIYGRRPTTGGGDGAVLRAITKWIPSKGLDLIRMLLLPTFTNTELQSGKHTTVRIVDYLKTQSTTL